ncbi:uncharacterized protein LOC119836001 isoform X2 [Zerene cesonia]|uniref:uncharacterized protein LOC119836001 isoform X2 n=1 Tax=Zerene cesonia TaxID=33412 RepID=UPI0018E56DCB|nr:uncharacterized protein LOC119836001 isoform X2 [Zerene cesonia]
MDEEGKLPLKRVELSLSKFNEVAIPHHLDLLRQHKANILKYEELGDYARVRSEQAHARRVASQLRSLLGELEALRRQVRTSDCTKFDQMTQRSRDLTLKAIMDYLETSPLSINRVPIPEPDASGSVVSSESVGIIPEQIQLQVDEHEVSLREREALLAGWSALQGEVRALHDAWQHVQAAALAHRDQINSSAQNVEIAADNVQEARSHLASAEKLRLATLGLGGMLVGALAGGPVGLALGAKAGAAAALAGSALGYMGAALLGRRARSAADTDAPPRADTDAPPRADTDAPPRADAGDPQEKKYR